MKHVLFIATGGTIASVKNESGSLSPSLYGLDLLKAVPEISQLAQCEVQQVMNIDSTNMQPKNWLEIAATIEKNYDNFDAFIILHGTDTLAYTAAALSYLIQNSAKPIVLTGAQLPINAPFTDAKLNLYQSVLYALDERASHVSVVFGGKVIAGTRAHKQKSQSADAFSSVNFPLLAHIRYDRILYSAAPGSLFKGWAQKPSSQPTFFHELADDVAVIKLTPGLPAKILDALMPTTSSLVLECFGVGGVPTLANAWSDALNDWINSGRSLALTTQVSEEGLDLGVYEVGNSYKDNPLIIDGLDMSTEALVAKLMWTRGLTTDICEIRELCHSPINFDRFA